MAAIFMPRVSLGHLLFRLVAITVMREMERNGEPMSPVTEVELLTIKEVAATLRVSEATVYRLREEGAFESIPVGGQWRILADSLRFYMTPRRGAA